MRSRALACILLISSAWCQQNAQPSRTELLDEIRALKAKIDALEQQVQ